VLPAELLADVRRARRHPRRGQFDYLHLRILRDDIAGALRSIDHPVRDVLDIYCGTRPYDDLLPAGARSTGLDIDNRWGAADVVSDEFLPFPDDSFDLVVCFEAFYYREDAPAGVAEIRRVLRPGGTVLMTVPLIWEYDRTTFEHRFTEPALTALFAGWSEVRVTENGGRGVAWATLTGRLLDSLRAYVPRRARGLVGPLFAAAFAAVNGIGALIERLDARVPGRFRLPMNLMLTAAAPATDAASTEAPVSSDRSRP
jgi:SAM-dependent methyltransferase